MSQPSVNAGVELQDARPSVLSGAAANAPTPVVGPLGYEGQDVNLSVSSQHLLSQAYHEFCLLQETGHHVTDEEFLARFPMIRSSLGRLLVIHREFAKEAQARQIEWPEIGASYHGFQLEQRLGEGAFSQVFLATQPKLGHRKVAVKITRLGDAEAFTLGRINHPNITPIHSIDPVPEKDLSIICMPYMGSATLCSLLDLVLASDEQPVSADIIRRAAQDPFTAPPLEPQEPAVQPEKIYEQGVRELFAEVCAALETLHAGKILHRDLKPSNILLRPDGTPVLLDFNLAKDAEAPGSHFGGTYAYMSPEHLRAMARLPGVDGDKEQATPLDERSDIYAIGVMLWETLTGQLPFGSLPKGVSSLNVIEELLKRQRAGFEAKLPSRWTVSPDMISIVRRCLSFDPKDRPATAAELRRLLTPQRLRRTLGLWVLGGAAMLAVAAIAIGASTPLSKLPFNAAVVERDSEDVAKHYEWGAKYWKEKDHFHAYEEFSKVVDARPADPRARWARALASVTYPTDDDADRLAKAEADSVKAANLERKMGKKPLAEAYHAYLMQLDKTGDPGKTIGMYRAAQKHGQAPIAVANNLAVLLSHPKPLPSGGQLPSPNDPDLDEAIKLLDGVLATDKSNAPALINRGIAYWRKSIFTSPIMTPAERLAFREKSVADFQKARALGVDSGELRYFLARGMTWSRDLTGVEPPLDPSWHEHLAKSLDLGYTPANFKFNADWTEVRNTPEFQKIAAREPAADKSKAMAVRLIPPITELPRWD